MSTEYRVYFTNGAMATVTSDIIMEDGEVSDELFDELYEARPSGLCHQCADNFDVGDDGEIYSIYVGTEEVYHEKTYQERMADRAGELGTQVRQLRAELDIVKSHRTLLTEALRERGFAVHPDTFLVL